MTHLTRGAIVEEPCHPVIDLERGDVEKAFLEHVGQHGAKLFLGLGASLTGQLLVLLLQRRREIGMIY